MDGTEMTHTEESLMALAYRMGDEIGIDKDLRLAIREVLERAEKAEADRDVAVGQRDWAIKQNSTNFDRAEKAEAECERLRKLLRETRQCVHKEANDEREMEGRGYYCDLAERVNAAIAQEAKP